MPSKRVPDDAERPCPCGRGILRVGPDPEPFYDADGLAQVDLSCDAADCSIRSHHSWTWT